MKPPFQLVPDEISGDTVEALKELHEQARRRNDPIIGVAFAVMYKERRYIIDTAGEARRSPTFALGMVNMLRRHLEKIIDA